MSRRSNGEGSVYRRVDGRWTGAHYVLRPDGGRVRRAVYAKTQRAALAKLAELVAKPSAGVPLRWSRGRWSRTPRTGWAMW